LAAIQITEIAMNRFTIYLTVLATGVFAAVAPAQNAPTYEVDKNASRVYIRVDRTNRLGHNHGVEGMLTSGSVTPGATGKLEFDMTTFVADTAQARKYVGVDGTVPAADARKVNDNMRGTEVLDVARFPAATLTIASFNPADRQPIGNAGRYLIDGQFTLHGVTRQIQILTELAGTNTPGVVSLKGWFKIKQTDFGMKPFAAVGGAVGVEDTLTIYGDLVLRAAAR
jgi:polyisoprenoid-binding protein YceI